MILNRSFFCLSLQHALCVVVCIFSIGIAPAYAGEEQHPSTNSASEPPYRPRTFDIRIADRLGVSNVAYLLAVDVNGKVVPFVPGDPKAAFRVIDPARDKLTMDLFEIEPFTIIAGKRNPFCVIFVGGSARKLWMESCP